MKKFDSPEKVESAVYFLKQADIPRSQDRALINNLFNGDQPWTDSEAEENKININVNFLDAPRIAHGGRNTFNNAFLKPGNYFTVTLDSGPVYKRSTWARQITKHINRIMKRSLPYTETLRAEFAQTVLHGVGPSMWLHKNSWRPCSIAIDDILFPSRTYVSLENLDFFAVYRQYTPWQLNQMANGNKVAEGWNKKFVAELLKKANEESLTTNALPSYSNTPEKLAEMMKSNTVFFDNEAVPTINCWDVLMRDDESDDEQWQRKMIVDSESETGFSGKFLYEPKATFQDSSSKFLHLMFADGANVAPFRYHSVRGLGWLLYAVCQLQNRLRCKFTDAVFEQFLWYFRVSSPEDRERLDKVDLHHLGVIPEGLDFVKAPERFQLRPDVVMAAMSMNRQSMSESAAQFQQDVNDGTQKEMTAAEVMTRMQTANALVGSMLQLAYTYQNHQYMEICRRFCIPTSTDPDVKKFQEACKKDGVPSDMLDVEKWNVEPERVLGAGNKVLEIAQAEKLMAVRNLFDPEPQREILHIYTEAMTDDPQIAERLAPTSKKQVSDSVHDAQLAAGTLMQGLPLSIKTGMDHIEYVEALLVSMGQKINQIKKSDNMGTQQDVLGLFNVAEHISEHISILSQDKAEKERVKRYGDALGNFVNLIKGFAQRLAEKNQQGEAGLSPEAQAKIQSALVLAQSQVKIKEAKAQQQMQQKDASFQAQLGREAQRHNFEMGKQVQQTKVDVIATDLETAAKIEREKQTPPPASE